MDISDKLTRLFPVISKWCKDWSRVELTLESTDRSDRRGIEREQLPVPSRIYPYPPPPSSTSPGLWDILIPILYLSHVMDQRRFLIKSASIKYSIIFNIVWSNTNFFVFSIQNIISISTQLEIINYQKYKAGYVHIVF